MRPKALTLSADAKRQWIDFYDDVERQSGPAGALRPVADLAAKIAEHACRIAGVLAVVERFDPIGLLDTDEIDGEAMAGGIALAQWYLDEAMRLQGSGQRDPALVRAQVLLDWLRDRKESETSFREIMRKGPAPTRLKAQADAALQVLAAHHWVQVMDDQPRNRPKIVHLLWRDTP